MGLLPFGDSYVRAKPCQGGILSCVPGPRWCGRECTELGPSWLRPSVPTPFLGLLARRDTCIGSHPWKRDCEPGASMVTSLDTQGGVDIRLWGPSARRQGVTSGHTAHPRSAGLGEPTPSGPPRCPRIPPRFPTELARKHALLARCGRARAGRAPPESIFSPH